MKKRLDFQKILSVIMIPLLSVNLTFGGGKVALASQYVLPPHEVYEGYIYPGDPRDFDVERAREEVRQADRHFQEISRKLDRAKRDFDIASERKVQKVREVRRAEQNLHAAQAEIDELQNKKTYLSNAINQKRDLIARNNQTISNQQTAFSNTNKEIESQRSQKASIDNSIKLTREKINKLNTDKQKVCAANEASNQCKKLTNDVNVQQNHLNNLSAQSSEIQKKIRELEKRTNDLKASIQNLTKQNAKLKEEIRIAEAEINSIPQTLAQALERKRVLMGRLSGLQNELRRLEREEQNARSNHDYWMAEANEARLRLRHAERFFARVQENYDRVFRHAYDTGRYFATVDGSREGNQRGSNDGYDKGRRVGFEVGKSEGIKYGIVKARERGTAIGKEEGRILGTEQGKQKAEVDGKKNGEADGFRDRGYDDAYDKYYNNPIITDERYKKAYEIGKKGAYAKANETHYPLGVKKANDEYYGTSLGNANLDNSSQTRSHESVSQSNLQADKLKALMRSLNVSLNTNDESYKTLSLLAQENVEKRDSIKINETSVLRNFFDYTIPMPDPNPNGYGVSWNYTYHNYGKVRYPRDDIQSHFESTYKSGYRDEAVRAYDRSFTDSYIQVFREVSQNEFDKVSSPDLYPGEEADARKIAKEFWRQKLKKDTYDALYPDKYAYFYAAAKANPDKSSSFYKSGFTNGTTNALTTRGKEDGYSQNIAQAQISEKEKGYVDRSNYFKNNADIKIAYFKVIDENEDSIFAVGESFSFEIGFENYGLKTQNTNSLKAQFKVYGGPARVIIDNVEIVKIPGQTKAKVKNILRGKILSEANINDTVNGEVIVYYLNEIIATSAFNFNLRYPMEISNIKISKRTFVNSNNIVTGTIENISTKKSPSSVLLSVLSKDLSGEASAEMAPIDAGEKRDFKVMYNFKDENLFETRELKVDAKSSGVLQSKKSLGETFVTKKFIPTSDVLIVDDDFTQSSWTVVNKLMRGFNQNFDVLDLSVEQDKFKEDALNHYKNLGFVSISTDFLSSSMTASIKNFLKFSGSILLTGRNLSQNKELKALLKDRNITFDGKSKESKIEGIHVLDGYDLNLLQSRELETFKVSSFWGLFSKPKFLNYNMVKSSAVFSERFVGARGVDFLEDFSNISVFTFNINELGGSNKADIISLFTLLNLDVREKINMLCGAGKVNGDANIVLNAIEFEILEEVQGSFKRKTKDKLYDPEINDIKTTSLWLYQDMVLRSQNCPYFKDLLSLYEGLHLDVDKSYHACQIVKKLKDVYIANGGYIPTQSK